MSDSSAGELTNERSTSPPSPTTQGDVAHRISVQALVCGSPIDLVPAGRAEGPTCLAMRRPQPRITDARCVRRHEPFVVQA